MIALLDVSVLLALLDSDHVSHQRARDWLSGSIDQGWASCPITQAGFIRVMAGPRYPSGLSVPQATGLLAQATNSPHHHFWPCDISPTDSNRIAPEHVLGPNQVTDVYLLALAVAHGGVFVTLDRRIAATAVPAAQPADLLVL